MRFVVKSHLDVCVCDNTYEVLATEAPIQAFHPGLSSVQMRYGCRRAE